jgi:hypothetical protein
MYKSGRVYRKTNLFTEIMGYSVLQNISDKAISFGWQWNGQIWYSPALQEMVRPASLLVALNIRKRGLRGQPITEACTMSS